MSREIKFRAWDKNKIKRIKTFEAKIYIGSINNETGQYCTEGRLENLVSEYVNEVKWCVTITKTKFIYVDGDESGWIIGIIQYPRFPEDEEKLKEKTLQLASILLNRCYQKRCSIIFPDETIMLESKHNV